MKPEDDMLPATSDGQRTAYDTIGKSPNVREERNVTDYLIKVTQLIKVSLDESKFTPEFMSEFRESFYQFHDIEDHARHIGQLVARGIHQASPYVPTEFVEGYGPIGDFGISAAVEDFDTEVEAP